MRLVVEMPWEKDLSVNHMRYGAGGGYRKKEHVRMWIHSLGYRVKAETIAVLWRLPIHITVDLRYPDKRKRDDHNFYKVICDAVAAGLGIDDKDIRISTGTIEVDKDNPGFTITVEDSK